MSVVASAEEARPDEPSSQSMQDPVPGASPDPEPPIVELREVRVEGRRLTPSRHRGSGARTVVTREEIEAKRPQALVDLLREQAGVDVRSTGGPGKQTSVFIRGASPDQVRVLIDGVLVGSSTVGSFDWANLSSIDIDRIEVLRGAQTTRYGAGAMGGVIEVFTREAETGISGTAYAGFGNEGHRQAGARLSGGLENGLRGAVAFEHSTINGVSAAEPVSGSLTSLENDPFRNTTTSAHVSIPTGAAGRARLFWRRSDAQTELDNFASDNEGFDQDTRQRQFGLDWRQPVTEEWTTRVFAAQHDDRIVGEDELLSFNNFDIESQRRQVSWVNDVVFGDLAFVGGVDLEKERAVNDDAGIREGTRRTGLFGELQYDGRRFGATGGVRREFNNRSTDEWTYQLGGRVTLVDGLDLLANFGTAFRAPTLNELFFSDPFSSGNPDLDPERSRASDLGLRWIGACECGLGWQVDVRAFHQSFENLIEFRDQGGFFFVAENVERARMSGAEADFRLDWRGFWLSGSYTNLRTRDAAGFRLARRSRHAGRLAIGGRWKRFRGEVIVHAVGRSFSSSSERAPVSGYWTADVHLGIELHEHLMVRMDLRNLTNHEYQEVAGRGTLPRMALFTVEAGF